MKERYAKSFTQPWKNSLVFDNSVEASSNLLFSSLEPIENAFNADVFGVPPLLYSWGSTAESNEIKADHFKMPVQNKPVRVQEFHLEAHISFSNLGDFMKTDLASSVAYQKTAASATVAVLLWHQKAAYLRQDPGTGNPYVASLYIPIGGLTRNIFTPMMQPYQDLIVGYIGHIDRFVGYNNKMSCKHSSSAHRNLSQDDTIAVSIVYQWTPNGSPGDSFGNIPPLEGTIALTYSALS